MGTLLLLLLGGAAAAAGAWAVFSRRDEAEKPPFFDLDERIRKGPRSSPELPEGGSQPEGGGRGRPVVISRGATRQLQEALAKGPVQIEATGAEMGPDRTAPEPARKRTKPLRVRHKADDTIGRASKHAHHRRALQNADSLVERGKAEEAKAIYERVKNRVDDPEIQRKLQENIDDINRWLEGVDREDDDDDDFIRFPQIIIPLSTQSIALENLTEGLRRVSESLVDQVNLAAARMSGAPMSPGGTPTFFPVAIPTAGPAGATAAADSVAQTATATAPILATAPITATAPVNITGPVTIMSGTPAFSPAGTPGYEERLRMKVPAPHPGDGELLTGTTDVEWSEAFQQVARKGGPGDEPLPPGLTTDDDGEVMTDGWTDADFERMWEKYKNLPLKDRRSGLDRRVHVDRRRDKKKDRRSGVERRKNDLFKEREEFLKKLEEHKKRKKDHEDWKKRNEDRKDRVKKAEAKAAPPKPGEPQIIIQHANVTIGDVEGLEPKRPEPPPPEPEKKPEEPPKTDVPPEMLVRQAPPDLDQIQFPEAEQARFEPPADDDGGGFGEPPELAGVPPEPEVEETAPEEKPGEGVESFSSVAPLDNEFENDFEPQSEEEPAQGPVQEIRGVLELKPPEEDDAPYLTLTYDFSKIPDSFQLSRDYNTMEYAYYKYKPMLLKAQEFTRRKMLKNALNYYRVIKSQAVPPEMKRMINRNIQDITEYLEKFLMSRG